MKAVLVFCEGNHDVVFAARSLGQVAGAAWMNMPIGELPSPLGHVPDLSQPNNPKIRGLISSRYSGRSLDESSLQAAVHPPVPAFEAILRDQNILYVLIRCNGDAAASAALELVNETVILLNPAFGTDVEQIAAAFLFDADTSLATREMQFAHEYMLLLDGMTAPTHGGWVNSTIPVGLYVFHDSSTQQGTLENVLGPLVAAEWNLRWAAADSYLSTHAQPTDPISAKPAEWLKAQINIAGQFVLPGDPMSQVIGRRGLSASHFSGHESRSLVAFLQAVPWQTNGLTTRSIQSA
ncbi:MAG: hypothetical protein AB7E72_06455 [Lysobacterales bacterium]